MTMVPPAGIPAPAAAPAQAATPQWGGLDQGAAAMAPPQQMGPQPGQMSAIQSQHYGMLTPLQQQVHQELQTLSPAQQEAYSAWAGNHYGGPIAAQAAGRAATVPGPTQAANVDLVHDRADAPWSATPATKA